MTAGLAVRTARLGGRDRGGEAAVPDARDRRWLAVGDRGGGGGCEGGGRGRWGVPAAEPRDRAAAEISVPREVPEAQIAAPSPPNFSHHRRVARGPILGVHGGAAPSRAPPSVARCRNERILHREGSENVRDLLIHLRYWRVERVGRRGLRNAVRPPAVATDTVHHGNKLGDGRGRNSAENAVLHEAVDGQLESAGKFPVVQSLSPSAAATINRDGRSEFKPPEVANFERPRGPVERSQALVLAGEVGERSDARGRGRE